MDNESASSSDERTLSGWCENRNVDGSCILGCTPDKQRCASPEVARSDTPRTDALWDKWSGRIDDGVKYHAMFQHARQLERELAEKSSQRDECERQFQEQVRLRIEESEARSAIRATVPMKPEIESILRWVAETATVSISDRAYRILDSAEWKAAAPSSVARSQTITDREPAGWALVINGKVVGTCDTHVGAMKESVVRGAGTSIVPFYFATDDENRALLEEALRRS